MDLHDHLLLFLSVETETNVLIITCTTISWLPVHYNFLASSWVKTSTMPGTAQAQPPPPSSPRQVTTDGPIYKHLLNEQVTTVK